MLTVLPVVEEQSNWLQSELDINTYRASKCGWISVVAPSNHFGGLKLIYNIYIFRL